MKRLRFSAQARRDLDDSWYYVAEHRGVEAADRLLQRIEQAIGLIARMPRVGRTREDLARKIRSYPAADHVIYYQEGRRRIQILRVLHGARDVRSIQIVH